MSAGLGTVAAAPWDAATGVAIGADWLLAAIAPGSAFGRAARERERPFRRGDEAAALAAIGRVDEVARALDAARLGALRAAIAAAPETAGALARAAAGGVLGDVDFFELTRFLDALSEVETLLTQGAPAGLEAPAVDEALRRSLAPGRSPMRSFYLDDAFGGDLAAARGERAAAQAAYDAARSRLAERVSAELGLERVRDGEFVVMRDGAPQPLPRAVRVLREAPAYFLCEVALDEAAQAALATRDRAADAVAQAEERVRASLSARVAVAAGGLEAAARALGELDLLLARAQFAQRYGCSLPALAEVPRISFQAARYLPLAETLERHARSYVPVSLELAGVGIVTGPNMGGKTAALRTLGFLVACVSLGLPVPAARASIPLFDAVAWIGIGSGGSGKPGEPAAESALLSAFGSEVVALRGLLERDAGRTLVLVDEFARTTSPREGYALLVAVVATLRERGASGLVATHLAGIAAAAGVPHFSSGALRTLDGRPAAAPLSLEVALRRIAGAMDYRLERVDEDAVPATDALALAEALGLDAGVIARARDALG